jgi:hypothetical protein
MVKGQVEATMTPEQLVSALQAAMRANLKSVTLYGSAAAGDFVPGVSGTDVFILVERLGADELTAVSEPLARWVQAGNPLPQLLTQQELVSSADVFPIELLDMKQSQRILFGSDPLSDIRIDMQHYRMQLERDLKTRLLMLRNRFLTCANDEQRVTSLMLASVSTFLVLLRAALRLYNDAVPAEKADALDQLAKQMKFDPQPFLAVLDLKNRQINSPPQEPLRLFASYLASIGQVVQCVDRQLHPSDVASQTLEDSHG